MKTVSPLLTFCVNAVIAGGITLAAPSHLAQADPRVPQLSGQYPYSAVGRLVSEIQGDDHEGLFCTGTLVWHNLVLTASHCFTDEKNHARNLPKTYSVFIPNLMGNAPAEPFVIKEIIVLSNDQVPVGAPDHTPDYTEDDWAILRLETSVPSSLGYMDVAAPKNFSSDGMRAVTYSPDFEDGIIAGIDYDCGLFGPVTVVADGQNFLRTNCDFMKGGSGGPVFSWSPGRRAVVEGILHSIVGGGAHSNIQKFAVNAQKASARINELRLQYPKPCFDSRPGACR